MCIVLYSRFHVLQKVSERPRPGATARRTNPNRSADGGKVVHTGRYPDRSPQGRAADWGARKIRELDLTRKNIPRAFWSTTPTLFATRNDVLGNLAVLVAALGVFGTGTGWPDVIVAVTMAVLALQGAVVVLIQSLAELHASAPITAE
jgi:hypothetical protein